MIGHEQAILLSIKFKLISQNDLPISQYMKISFINPQQVSDPLTGSFAQCCKCQSNETGFEIRNSSH